MSLSQTQILHEKLKAYKKKYYINLLLKGSIFFISFVSASYLLFTLLEYFGRFESLIRIVFFFSFIAIALFSLIKWISIPIWQLTHLDEHLSDEKAAKQVGSFFPEIKDKLLNTLQLESLSGVHGDLISASIEQKTKELSVIPFTNAINLKENRKYLRVGIIPLLIIAILLLFLPGILTEGTSRILQYNKTFIPPAPFQFHVKNKSLQAYKNEDFNLELSLSGSALPDQVYFINEGGKRTKMKKESNSSFSFTFKNIQHAEKFVFEAAGYNSVEYKINVVSKPDLRSFDAYLKYPTYLNKKSESLQNAGNMVVPEGTSITWEFETADCDKVNISFPTENKNYLIESKNNLFRFSKKALSSEEYSLQLQNSNSLSDEKIKYSINVIKDIHPAIQAEQIKDTSLFNRIIFGGNITDDYGLTQLKLFYKKVKNKNPGNNTNYESINIPVDQKYNNQNFYYNWAIDSIALIPGETLEYFLQVWDNDGVNGRKSSKTQIFSLKLPSKEEIRENIDITAQQAENKMESILSKTLDLQRDINKMQQKLKTKNNNLTWQDKKSLEDILKKHNDLNKELEELKKTNEQMNQMQQKFSETDMEMAVKMEQLQKLMDELLDEETKKLFEELQKMMNENLKNQDLQKLLDKMDNKEQTLEKELERALEMFKQMQFEQKLDQTVKDLKELSEKQQELSEKSLDKQADQKSLQEQQEQLNKEFDKVKEDLKKLSEMNKDLETPNQMENTDQKQQDISQKQQNSSQQLQKGQNKKASESQKEASEEMEEMADKLEAMQSQSESQQAQENLDDLRDILENLIKLSFDQEELMKDFKKVNQSDPRFIELSQKQLKLKDDSKVIEDSLYSLAKRVYQIESFVTREVGNMKQYMGESMDALKVRRPDIAAGKQQLAMTSMNNLALLLNDALKQMQQQMQQQMQSKGGKQCKNPGKGKPNMGELQKQLNGQIEQLKKSGKTGRELSEELAKLAAQQEMIRQAMKEMEKFMEKEGGKNASNKLSELKKMMEESEKDLVNKQITQETLYRQREILTRLLEAEKSVRERDLDEKRESKTADQKQQEVPPSFEKYLKAKEKQIELLKTVPPSLNPYYKQEVNEYFQKIEK